MWGGERRTDVGDWADCCRVRFGAGMGQDHQIKFSGQTRVG